MDSAISIATLNTNGAVWDLIGLLYRYREIAKYFENSKIELIHFQEVLTYFHLIILKFFLRHYPSCSYKPYLIGPKGGLVTFSRRKIMASSHFSFERKRVPWAGKLRGMIVQNGMHLTQIEGLGVDFINLHLTVVANHDWNRESTYFAELLSEIRQLHALLVKSQALVVITGDFNISKNSDLYHELSEQKGLRDVFKNYDFPTVHRTWTRKSGKPQTVDYVFTYGKSDLLRPVRTQAIFARKTPRLGFVSDHLGLTANLAFRLKS